MFWTFTAKSYIPQLNTKYILPKFALLSSERPRAIIGKEQSRKNQSKTPRELQY